MFTSTSEVLTPAELSMKSVLMRPPDFRGPPDCAYSTRPRCVQPRLPPSPITLARISRPSARIASLARSRTSACDSSLRLHVGADAAVPQQVDRHAQDGAHDLDGRCRSRLETEQRARLGGQRNGLGGARPNAAAARDELARVVVPARARQFEQALALAEARGRIRIRVEEDVPVIEGGDQPRVLRQQHAVAEHVARHVADARAGEVLRLDVERRSRGSGASRTPTRRAR